MRFKEIVTRLTGFSVPIFGVSWNPPEPHVAVARRVVSFLEDRRVLYNPYDVEVPDHCVHSIIEIRGYLTDEIGKLPGSPDAGLPQTLRAMRAGCRKFLDTVQADRGQITVRDMLNGGTQSWIFLSALGQLRNTIGTHVAVLAAQHGLDVEKDLASILPPAVSADDGDGAHGGRGRRRSV
ncbi:MAG: hypothetical protein QOF78_4148 [Phycisphaerales bacterium]|jgi:hypothetical protein|nr:hypothetical protein [Phycisphaerales bacterium]